MGLRYDRTGFGDIVICQDERGFRYGTDAVILAHEASKSPKASRQSCVIGDLGTGTGIVPLILSEKTGAGRIWGMEVQEACYELAVKNALDNGLSDRVKFMRCDVRDLADRLKEKEMEEMAGAFDIITANPPYMAKGEGIESRDDGTAIARHEIMGGLDDFIRCASLLLKDKGDFYMIHRPGRLVDICQGCRRFSLEPKEMTFISGKPMEKPKLLLVKAVKNGGADLKIKAPFAVRSEEGQFTEEMLRAYGCGDSGA